ncbi:MAG TPA: hypothetical protein VM695_10170 [Phycisphaerae bacterium]|nr:hypothetical protein [Phycisphaerae bacterium]
MPLTSGKSRRVIEGNVHEMLHSSTFAAGKSHRKRVEMAVAAAVDKAGIPKRGKRSRRRLRKRAREAKARKDAGSVRHLAALGLAKGAR